MSTSTIDQQTRAAQSDVPVGVIVSEDEREGARATPWDTGTCRYCGFTGNEHSSAQSDTCTERFALDVAADTAQAAHEAAEARLEALAAVREAARATEEALEDVALTEEDKTALGAFASYKLPWLAMTARVEAARATTLALEDVAYDARRAVDAWEADHPEIES